MIRILSIMILGLFGCIPNKKSEHRIMMRGEDKITIVSYVKTSPKSTRLERKIIAEYPTSNNVIDVNGKFFYLAPSKEAIFSSDIKQFIQKELELPDKHNISEAFCVCYAFISKKGKFVDYGLIKAGGGGYDEKAIDCVSKMKKWIPAYNEDGIPINSVVHIFIKFPHVH
jgi:hypothetical protein